jgi:hypothetical protein
VKIEPTGYLPKHLVGTPQPVHERKRMGLKEKLGKQGNREQVELEIDGEKLIVDIQEPNSVRVASAVKACGGADEGGEPKDFGLFVASLIAQSVYEPGTTKRVFGDGDLGIIVGAGRQIDPLQKAVMKALGGKSDLPKESAGTPSTEPDSSSHSDSAGPSST